MIGRIAVLIGALVLLAGVEAQAFTDCWTGTPRAGSTATCIVESTDSAFSPATPQAHEAGAHGVAIFGTGTYDVYVCNDGADTASCVEVLSDLVAPTATNHLFIGAQDRWIRVNVNSPPATTAVVVIGGSANVARVGGAGSGGGFYQTWQDEGVGLPQRDTADFTGAGVTCADGGTKTICSIPGGAGIPTRLAATTCQAEIGGVENEQCHELGPPAKMWVCYGTPCNAGGWTLVTANAADLCTGDESLRGSGACTTPAQGAGALGAIQQSQGDGSLGDSGNTSAEIDSNSAHRGTTAGNPHAVTAAEAGAEPAGSVATHAALPNVHHVPPAPSNATPLVESGAGAPGTQADYSRRDHVHPAAGGDPTVGPAGAIQQSNGSGGHGDSGHTATDIGNNSAHRGTTTGNPHSLDAADVGAEPAGSVATHAGLPNAHHTPPAASSATPLVESGTGAPGVGTDYSRNDHVHPAGPSDTPGPNTITQTELATAGDAATADGQIVVGLLDGTFRLTGCMSTDTGIDCPANAIDGGFIALKEDANIGTDEWQFALGQTDLANPGLDTDGSFTPLTGGVVTCTPSSSGKIPLACIEPITGGGTPSDATPEASVGAGSAGVGAEYSRGDHTHPAALEAEELKQAFGDSRVSYRGVTNGSNSPSRYWCRDRNNDQTCDRGNRNRETPLTHGRGLLFAEHYLYSDAGVLSPSCGFREALEDSGFLSSESPTIVLAHESECTDWTDYPIDLSGKNGLVIDGYGAGNVLIAGGGSRIVAAGATVVGTGLTITIDATPVGTATLTRSAGSWLTDGVTVGMYVLMQAAASPGAIFADEDAHLPLKVTNVTATVLTVEDQADELSDETSVAGVAYEAGHPIFQLDAGTQVVFQNFSVDDDKSIGFLMMDPDTPGASETVQNVQFRTLEIRSTVEADHYLQSHIYALGSGVNAQNDQVATLNFDGIRMYGSGCLLSNSIQNTNWSAVNFKCNSGENSLRGMNMRAGWLTLVNWDAQILNGVAGLDGRTALYAGARGGQIAVFNGYGEMVDSQSSFFSCHPDFGRGIHFYGSRFTAKAGEVNQKLLDCQGDTALTLSGMVLEASAGGTLDIDAPNVSPFHDGGITFLREGLPEDPDRTVIGTINLPPSTVDSFQHMSGETVVDPASIPSGTCAAAETVATAGVLATDRLTWNFDADPTGVLGYTPATTGAVYLVAYPTAGNVNFKVCNPTASAIDPGAVTLNWRVDR